VGYPTCADRPHLPKEEDTIAKRALDKYKGRLTPEQIAEGINAASRNAVRLVGDADLLLESERFPSAAALAILAIEEAGKVAILRELSVAQEEDKALDNCWRDYRRHTKKNVAWLLPQLVAEGGTRPRSFSSSFWQECGSPVPPRQCETNQPLHRLSRGRPLVNSSGCDKWGSRQKPGPDRAILLDGQGCNVQGNRTMGQTHEAVHEVGRGDRLR
jgi:AbiV family abortive infection protein